jgi:adenosine kinase
MLPEKSVVYLGCVGKDKYADALRAANDKAGLRTEYLVDEKEPTGRCGVVITGHNRSMVTHLAAANNYKLDHLKSPEIWKLAEAAKFYYVGGYHLTVCVPAILALAEEAAAKDKVFAFGMGAPFIPQFFKDGLDQVAPYWDYVFMNESEAAAWAGSHGHEDLGEKDTEKIARLIADLPKKNEGRKRVVVISQGTEPTLVATQGENDVKSFPVHEVATSEIVDTNGAG